MFTIIAVFFFAWVKRDLDRVCWVKGGSEKSDVYVYPKCVKRGVHWEILKPVNQIQQAYIVC